MIRFFQISLLACLLLLNSCDFRPWSVLNKQEMEDVLFDIHLAETIFQVYKPGYSQEDKQQIFEGIFKKHHTTKEEFDNSLKWYAKHPDELQLIYRKVLDKSVDFQYKVDNYYYHPESCLSALDSIDTFNLWLGRRKIVLPQIKKSDKVQKDLSLFYQNTDNRYLFKNDTLKYNLTIRVISPDSTIYYSGMIFNYDDGSADSMLHHSYADSLVRHIYFKKILPEDKNLTSFKIIVVDSLRGINSLCIDTISLDRVYDKFNNRLSFNVLKSIINTQDSIKNVESKLFEKN